MSGQFLKLNCMDFHVCARVAVRYACVGQAQQLNTGQHAMRASAERAQHRPEIARIARFAKGRATEFHGRVCPQHKSCFRLIRSGRRPHRRGHSHALQLAQALHHGLDRFIGQAGLLHHWCAELYTNTGVAPALGGGAL